MSYYVIPKIETEYFTIPAIDTTYYSVGEISTTFYVINAFACFWRKVGLATWKQFNILGIGSWYKLHKIPYITRYYIMPKPDTTFYEVT